jgi:hypothetical protein
MSDVENATPFGVRVMPSGDREGRDLLLIVIAAHFELPGPGYDDPRLRLLRTQELPPLADVYAGEPGQSSILREGQAQYVKPATDIYVSGEACAPRGEPVSEMGVSIRVGPAGTDLRVFGDRVWQRAVTLGVRPSSPTPFVRMPLVWERAYGGVAAASTEARPAFEPRNPVGCGFETDVDAAVDKPVPNLENPRHLLNRVSDRPQPIGVGPIARHWQPRAAYSGTYDDAWRRQRAPLWPVDFDERFLCGATERLQVSPHLQGGEAVHLKGLHADGDIGFLLPRLRLTCRTQFVDRVVRTTPVLDGLLLDTTGSALTMYYRAAVPALRAFVKHRETLVRMPASWEDGAF